MSDDRREASEPRAGKPLIDRGKNVARRTKNPHKGRPREKQKAKIERIKLSAKKEKPTEQNR